MGEDGGHGGKIALGILAEEDRWEAAEADLILRGIDIEDLSARQLAAAVRGLMADPTTLTAKAHGGDGYTVADHLSFLLLDALRLANWQRSKDGSKGRNRPKPTSPLAARQGVRHGRTDRSPAEVRALLARHGPRNRQAHPASE